MKAMILAGGLGTRMTEETEFRPKPMVLIGGRPLLWHIMSHYARHGIKEFVVCLGYKGYMIKEYFLNYYAHNADLRIDLGRGTHTVLNHADDDWTVTLIDTGEASNTGGRMKRARRYVEDGTFCLTYGDGLSNIDLTAEIAFHRSHGKLATLASIRAPMRFGVIEAEGTRVTGFAEKLDRGNTRISGGFFVLEPAVLDRIADDMTIFEHGPLRSLAADDELRAFEHNGFWQPCDTVREKIQLEEMWRSGPPWVG